MADQLTALDATFLELEEADQGAHMHIGGVMVFDPLPDGGTPTVEMIHRHLSERLVALPRYFQRLSEVHTGGLNWPEWQAHPDFDLAGHISRFRLPAPGGDEELAEWAAEFYSQRLDRSRPLWEIALVEGLADGRWALATKTHHCMVDGVGSVDVAFVLLDTEPDGSWKAPDSGPARDRVEPEPPAYAGLLRRGAGALGRITSRGRDLAMRPVRGAFGLVIVPGRAREALHAARALVEVIVRDEIIAAPKTSLNVPIGGKRRLGVATVPLEEIKQLKNALGGTVNDVVLATAAGGVRRFLKRARQEDVRKLDFRVMAPVSMRDASQRGKFGNRVSAWVVPLPVNERDPLARYERVRKATAELKRSHIALAADTVMQLTEWTGTTLLSLGARLMDVALPFNLVVTNVPGPRDTLYLLGARLLESHPMIPLMGSLATGIALMSYRDTLSWGFCADWDLVPDLHEFVVAVDHSFRKLAEAAGVES
jgi:WS/DGAT/MGAT family acyltransferase